VSRLSVPASRRDGSEPLPHVAVIVLHWGPLELTSRCLHSLSRTSFTGKMTIFLIDNACALDRGFGEQVPGLDVEIRRAGHNLGFAGGCAWGISLALEAAADYILLLNNDVTVEPSAIDHLVAAASQAPEAGLLCPQIVSTSRPPRAWYVGGSFSLWSGIPTQSRPAGRGLEGDEARDVDYATGCVMLIDPAVIRTIGSFDTAFFAYCEDLDLSLRARQAGFRILFVPRAVVHHEVAAHDRLSLSIYYSTRNLLEVLRRHGAWYHWLGFVPNFVVRWVGFFVGLALMRRRPEYVSALAHGIGDFTRGRLGERERRADARR